MNEEEGITGSERFRVFSRDDEGNHFNPIILTLNIKTLTLTKKTTRL